ncbi:Uncharacterised protein [Mycobacteroides abscessus subsp. abscessus]|uniref:DUF4333 domain-containing protein n=1 Tax=Mycobacteroides abscessus TaxID=36809 RepID=UPI0009285455|nr:DUF4333 domain-containing protein [Mycobacteroides abscessus]SHS99906.1 Uncharacterised protein [Mycobacteroides abscessus subsp. abscessus]SLK63975.1 Uncharacterised protein [Mycobacteroides abscessus subsp. abscessus]
MKAVAGSVLVACSVVLAGCNVSVDIGSRPEIDKDRLAVGVSDALRDKTGETPVTSKCDGGLRKEPGAKQRCWVSNHKGELFGVTTTTTSVNGDKIKFDVDVDAKPADKSP